MKKSVIKNSDQLKVERRSGEIYSHIRKKWFIETPEERVRQEYLGKAWDCPS